MTTGLEKLYEDLGDKPTPLRPVLRGDNTIEMRAANGEGVEFTGEGLDRLFGGFQHYHIIKNEKPWHRVVLWHAVNGLNGKEIADLVGHDYTSVKMVMKQDWFRRALVSILNERGREANKYIQGQELASFEKLVFLRDNAKEEGVQRGAANDILDRIRGKPVAKTEVKQETTVDIAVHDADALLRERRELDAKMRANGLLPGSS